LQEGGKIVNQSTGADARVPMMFQGSKMRYLIFLLKLIFIFSLLLNCSILFSRSSPNVPIDNHVYRDIDKLAAAGLIKDAMFGQRPWSRMEIARLITQARRQFGDRSTVASNDPGVSLNVMVAEILERLESEYREELSDGKPLPFHFLEEVSLDATVLKSPIRSVPEENGLGSIKAKINPLVAYREGRHFTDGGTLGFETVHWAQISDYFSVYARPRFEMLMPGTGSSGANVRGQEIYGKFNFRNFELEIGRDALVWGSGEHGGELASNNARNLDMLKISNDSPLIHPWIFKYLGPSKYTLFAADLGPDYVLKNAFLFGFSATIKPVSFLEIGFEHQMTMGGQTAPNLSFKDFMLEFFFQRPIRYSQHSPYNLNFADHHVGLNVRTEVPQLHHSVIYGEGIFEDFGRESFWPQFTQQMAFLLGYYFPLFTADGSDDLRIEYEHIPAAYARHGIWTSGLTETNFLRGSALGPDGQGIHIAWRHSLPSGIQTKSEMHYEARDSNTYTATTTSQDQADRIILAVDNPMEHRFRIATSFDWNIRDHFVIQPEFGFERVLHYAFNPALNRNNLWGAISLKWFPTK
jgi:hypothetical protein